MYDPQLGRSIRPERTSVMHTDDVPVNNQAEVRSSELKFAERPQTKE